MAGNSPLDKYNNTNSRVCSSTCTGTRAQSAVQPKYNHPPVPKPNYETTKPRLVWNNDNPKLNTKISPLERIPTPFGVGLLIGGAIGKALHNYTSKQPSSIVGKDYKAPTPEERSDYLTREIKKYNPDFTFNHPKDEKGAQYLADQLHYEQSKYLNIHQNGCRTDFNLDLYNKTVRDLDGKVAMDNIINNGTKTSPSNTKLQEQIKKAAYEDYKANGGTLGYDDWGMTVWGKGGSASNVTSYNSNIKTHLSTVDGFSQKKGVIGGHNMEAFNQAVADNNLKIISSTDHPTIKGLKQVEYQIPSFDRAGNVTGYKNKIFTKTIYDPKIITDNQIFDLGKQAADKGYSSATSQGLSQYSSEAGGINFRVYIRNDIVDNYHPEF